MHSYNPSPWGAEAGGLRIGKQPVLEALAQKNK